MHKWLILLQKSLTSYNNLHKNLFMSLKATNESYRALLARALRSKLVAHIKKYRRQMMAMLPVGVVSNRGNATIGGSAFWWQCYYRSGRQMMAMQQKELM